MTNQNEKKLTKVPDSNIKISNNTNKQVIIKIVRIRGRQPNKRRSVLEYLTVILFLRGINLNFQLDILIQFQILHGGNAVPGTQRRKGTY